MKLKPVAGEVEIEVTFGDYGVVVTPSALEFNAHGATEQLVATVYDQYGEEVADAVPQLEPLPIGTASGVLIHPHPAGSPIHMAVRQACRERPAKSRSRKKRAYKHSLPPNL